jgi:hypothetical protein
MLKLRGNKDIDLELKEFGQKGLTVFEPTLNRSHLTCESAPLFSQTLASQLYASVDSGMESAGL